LLIGESVTPPTSIDDAFVAANASSAVVLAGIVKLHEAVVPSTVELDEIVP
jgi:hypothetical protein